MKNNTKGMLHLWLAFSYSINGLRSAFKNEAAFRHELLLGIPHILAVVLLPMPMLMRMFFVALFVLLLVVELINSAIEAIVDLVSPAYHELAKRAKDYGSAALYLVLNLIFLGWAIVFISYILKYFVLSR